MNYPNSDILVSPEWLVSNKENEDLVIVDCPWEYYSYIRAHIPGAVCRPGHAYIKALDEEGGQTVLVAGTPEVEKLLEDLGIGTGSTVVAYDEWGSMFATRLWWVLRYYGFDNVKILDGGWQNWVSSGFPVSFVSSKPAEVTEPFKLKTNPGVIATLEKLRGKYQDPDWQVLDMRSGDEYDGRAAHGNRRTGHVPGAEHLEWSQLLENSGDGEGVRKFKPASEVAELLQEAGVDGSKNIITHCQAAVRATFTAFALELMGFNTVKVYDGSMAEWANRDDTPLE